MSKADDAEEILNDILGDGEKTKDIVAGLVHLVRESRITNKKQAKIVSILKEIRDSDEARETKLADALLKLHDTIGDFDVAFPEELGNLVSNQAHFQEVLEKTLSEGIAVKESDWWKELNTKKISDEVAKALRKTVLKVNVSNPPKELTPKQLSSSFTKALKGTTVKVNIADRPKELSIKKPSWWQDLNLVKTLKDFTQYLKESVLDVRIINTEASDPIAVRLSNGKVFYNAIMSVIRSSISAFSDSSGNDRKGLVDSSRHVQVDVLSNAVPTGLNGGPITVGTTAVELTFSGVTKSIEFQSDHDNDGKIWWGDSNVTSAGANAHGRLGPGQSKTIDIDDASAPIYVVSDTASQTVYKNALT